MAGVGYVAGTFDTKHAELTYVAGLLTAAGIPVRTVDLSTSGTGGQADVSAAEVAAWHPDGADAVFTGDRGTSVAAMAEAFAAYLPTRSDVGGVLGLGGSGGTALITPAMRAMPVGVPKMMVSTVVSGDVASYVGGSDIALFAAVTDIAGLNRISRHVLGNAAHALAGALAHPVPASDDLPAVALSMFGVTTPCVTAVSERLSDSYDCLVFHATGVGGMAMEKLVTDGLVGAVLDLTTTEICDLIAGGAFSAGEARLDAIAGDGVPYVGSAGALDMVNFYGMDSVPERYRDRLLYQHNPQVTLMRTSEDECRSIGSFIAAKLNAADGPVRFLIPEGGVSAMDAPGAPFHDEAADAALFDTLEREVVQTERRRLVRVPAHINDTAFVDAVLAAFHEVHDPQLAAKGLR